MGGGGVGSGGVYASDTMELVRSSRAEFFLQMFKGSDFKAIQELTPDRLRKIAELMAIEGIPDTKDLIEIIREPDTAPAPFAPPTSAEMIEVRMIRNERGLSPERQQIYTSYAVDEREAFEELLVISGLDDLEIEAAELTFERLGGPVPLLDELRKLTGHEFEIGTEEVKLPLRDSVKRQLDDR